MSKKSPNHITSNNSDTTLPYIKTEVIETAPAFGDSSII